MLYKEISPKRYREIKMKSKQCSSNPKKGRKKKTETKSRENRKQKK